MMRARILLLTFVVACQPPVLPAPTSGPQADIAYLASPALAGRETGTAGNDSAAVFIARRFDTLHLVGAFRARCNVPRCPEAFFQPFRTFGVVGKNVGAIIPGSDSSVAAQFVVIGAHYDHLGRGGQGVLDREAGAVVHPGADDNASGTAAVLELARRFAAHPARRSIMVVCFDAEEIGLVGSGTLVTYPPVPLRSIVFMLNLDMIGRLRGDRVYVDAEPESDAERALMARSAALAQLHAQRTVEIRGRSDHASFVAAGIPAVALFTGFHADYHKVSDRPAHINVEGMERVITMGEAIARSEADRE